MILIRRSLDRFKRGNDARLSCLKARHVSSVFFLRARLRRDAIIESRPRSILPAGRRFA